MAKIGQNARLKQVEAAPYATLGIVKTEDGYELRKVTVSGMDVKSVKVLGKAKERAEIMMALQMALSQYTINFNQKESGE
jgi:NAD(P)H-nitrite reductase large subunit